MPTGLQHPLCLSIGQRTITEKHRTELTEDEVENRVFKRQGLGVRLLPSYAVIRCLPRRGKIEHRLIEIGHHIVCGRQ
ncbi:hypothetical protein D3C87_1013480 [compost metagenome]